MERILIRLIKKAIWEVIEELLELFEQIQNRRKEMNENENEKAESGAEIWGTTEELVAQLKHILTELHVPFGAATPEGIARLIEAFKNQ